MLGDRVFFFKELSDGFKEQLMQCVRESERRKDFRKRS